jgi:glycerol-1-phosphate dehydrogenase [NAD(P)+]
MALVVPVFAIAQAPRRTLVSGMADLSVNGLAIMDWEWARELHGEPFDDYAALLGRSAAELILARRDLYEPGRRFTDEDVEILVHGLVLSGLAMTVAGSSRPCSGPEHLISHAFDALGLGEGLHGEQVALGARVAVRFLGPAGGRVVELLDRIGAPRSPDEIGIGRDDALRAVRIAGSVRPERRSRLAAALAADPDHVVAEAEAAWYG